MSTEQLGPGCGAAMMPASASSRRRQLRATIRDWLVWLRTGRSEAEQLAAEVSHWRKRELKRLWREACEGSGLAHCISTPSGRTVAIPRIAQIVLGDDSSWLKVRLRSGQLPSDIDAAASRLAYTMGLSGLRVTELVPMWVWVELLTEPSPPGGHGVTPIAPLRPPTPVAGGQATDADQAEAA